MKTTFKLFLLIVILGNFYLNAQEVGVIFTKSEADQKFGEVIDTTEISSAQLTEFLNKTGNYLLFKIANKNLYILDESRNPLYPSNLSIDPEDVYELFSVSKVEELLKQGESKQTFFEKRKNVFSITNANYTLEQGALCPPWCVQ